MEGSLREAYIRRELWWQTKAKEMTEMEETRFDGFTNVSCEVEEAGLKVSKAKHDSITIIPGSAALTLKLGSPFSSAGIAGPLNITVPTMSTILTSATALAFDRFSMSLYSESG